MQLDIYPEYELLDYMVILFCNFLRNHLTAFYSSILFYIPTNYFKFWTIFLLSMKF